MGTLITLIRYIRAIRRRQPGYFTVYISEIAANAISKCAYNICNNEYLHVSISKLVHSSTTVTITIIL